LLRKALVHPAPQEQQARSRWHPTQGRQARSPHTDTPVPCPGCPDGHTTLSTLFQAIGRRLGCHGSQQYLLAHLGQFIPELGSAAERIWVATRMVESH
jgi:hypothetical protein